MLVETGYAEGDGGRLYYETSGKSPVLVLIHAGFLDSRMWDTQFQLFSKNYMVIRYDVRGFGRSDIARTKFSDYKDLRGILDHLRVKTASLIGVSNGGRIASDFAVEYPSMVDHLVLVSPGISGYKASGPEEEKLWEEFDKQMKLQEDADREGRTADAVEMDKNHSNIPGSKKVLIQAADHIVNMSKSDEFNRTVLEFFREQTQEIQA